MIIIRMYINSGHTLKSPQLTTHYSHHTLQSITHYSQPHTTVDHTLQPTTHHSRPHTTVNHTPQSTTHYSQHTIQSTTHYSQPHTTVNHTLQSTTHYSQPHTTVDHTLQSTHNTVDHTLQSTTHYSQPHCTHIQYVRILTLLLHHELYNSQVTTSHVRYMIKLLCSGANDVRLGRCAVLYTCMNTR
jgi:hypothetical protein